MTSAARRSYPMALLAVSCNIATLHAAAPELETEQQRLLYYMGTLYGERLQQLQLTEEELNLVMLGSREAATGSALELDTTVYGAKLQEFADERREALLANERSKAAEYLAQMAAEKGATKTETGLIFQPLEPGNGKSPTTDSVVELNYHGTLRDGTVFDSSVNRGKSMQVLLKMVIPCWQESITMMRVGARAKITCPADLAYAERGVGQIPPGAAVTYELSLLRIVR